MPDAVFGGSSAGVGGADASAADVDVEVQTAVFGSGMITTAPASNNSGGVVPLPEQPAPSCPPPPFHGPEQGSTNLTNRSSMFHYQVSLALSDLGMDHNLEKPLPGGYTADIQLKDDPSKLIEIDGPMHFRVRFEDALAFDVEGDGEAASSTSAGAGRDLTSVPNSALNTIPPVPIPIYDASSQLKHRLLTKLGFQVFHIPYFQWPGRRIERTRFLQNLLWGEGGALCAGEELHVMAQEEVEKLTDPTVDMVQIDGRLERLESAGVHAGEVDLGQDFIQDLEGSFSLGRRFQDAESGDGSEGGCVG